jgi:hypothetical protein
VARTTRYGQTSFPCRLHTSLYCWCPCCTSMPRAHARFAAERCQARSAAHQAITSLSLPCACLHEPYAMHSCKRDPLPIAYCARPVASCPPVSHQCHPLFSAAKAHHGQPLSPPPTPSAQVREPHRAQELLPDPSDLHLRRWRAAVPSTSSVLHLSPWGPPLTTFPSPCAGHRASQ